MTFLDLECMVKSTRGGIAGGRRLRAMEGRRISNRWMWPGRSGLGCTASRTAERVDVCERPATSMDAMPRIETAGGREPTTLDRPRRICKAGVLRGLASRWCPSSTAASTARFAWSIGPGLRRLDPTAPLGRRRIYGSAGGPAPQECRGLHTARF
jgi:hypothetical protein